MSVCSVVPDCSISSAASLDPIRTISGDTVFPSAGKMYFWSQSMSARSSASPRYMTMAAWPCVLMRPGSTTMPPAWMTSAAAKRFAMAAGVSTATIVVPLIATAPGDRMRPPGVHGDHGAPGHDQRRAAPRRRRGGKGGGGEHACQGDDDGAAGGGGSSGMRNHDWDSTPRRAVAPSAHLRV